MSDDDLNARLAALCPPGTPRSNPRNDDAVNDLDTRVAALCRRKGRPPNGFDKAFQYSDEVWALRRDGVPRWRSIEMVAEKHQKTPGHISACVKMIVDTHPDEYSERDDTLPDE